jgi:FKBP-type peptidyl-prolyl cis-trans isomerase FkpA
MNYLTPNNLKTIGLALFTIIFMSCGGGECDLQLNLPDPSNSDIFNNELAQIESYLEQNNLTANVTASGLHYIIEEPGTGTLRPSLCDEVNVDYRGYFMDGEIFDQNDGITFGLNNVIKGWGEGIQLFGRGGEGTIIIPSYMGYGGFPPPGIPANSILIFDVTINDF